MVIAQAIVIAKMHRRRGWVFPIRLAPARNGDAPIPHAEHEPCRSREKRLSRQKDSWRESSTPPLARKRPPTDLRRAPALPGG